MRYILLLFLFTSCVSINRSRTPTVEVNDSPGIRVPFTTADTDGDGMITKEEYTTDTRTVDIETPSDVMLSVIVSVGVLVGVLIFLTTCYKGPTGIQRK